MTLGKCPNLSVLHLSIGQDHKKTKCARRKFKPFNECKTSLSIMVWGWVGLKGFVCFCSGPWLSNWTVSDKLLKIANSFPGTICYRGYLFSKICF